MKTNHRLPHSTTSEPCPWLAKRSTARTVGSSSYDLLDMTDPTAKPEAPNFGVFLQTMVHHKGSDMFISAGFPPSVKVHGRLQAMRKEPLSANESRDLVVGIMNPGQKEQFEKTHECNFAIAVARTGRFRVSAFFQKNNVGMVIRRIEGKIPSLEELDLPNIIRELAMEKRGIVIFVGGTGAGKSSSLAAVIGYRNQHSSGHIITIEDPIEFVHQHAGCMITQREIGVDTDDWDNALKNTLRQAPDVIMIGEVRTRETMEHAIAFAETGHLCLCTLHANNANQAIDRIINFFPEERKRQLLMDLSLNVRGIVAQQLIPTKDGKGRKAVLEILLGTTLIQDVIRDGEIHRLKEIMRDSGKEGMMTFDQSLVESFRDGHISYNDALAHADSSNEVRLKIKLLDDNSSVLGGLEGAELERRK
jgi:twitching motility protein PilU